MIIRQLCGGQTKTADYWTISSWVADDWTGNFGDASSWETIGHIGELWFEQLASGKLVTAQSNSYGQLKCLINCFH